METHRRDDGVVDCGAGRPKTWDILITMSERTVAVIMPAYNEASVISGLIARIPRIIDTMPVIPLVVDDGSNDGTDEAAVQSGALVIRHLANLGVGAATVTGFRAAQELNAHIIVTMDADGQHNPEEIPSLVHCLVDGRFDVVIGSR